jgi:hypothetical protein
MNFDEADVAVKCSGTCGNVVRFVSILGQAVNRKKSRYLSIIFRLDDV